VDCRRCVDEDSIGRRFIALLLLPLWPFGYSWQATSRNVRTGQWYFEFEDLDRSLTPYQRTPHWQHCTCSVDSFGPFQVVRTESPTDLTSVSVLKFWLGFHACGVITNSSNIKIICCDFWRSSDVNPLICGVWDVTREEPSSMPLGF